MMYEILSKILLVSEKWRLINSLNKFGHVEQGV